MNHYIYEFPDLTYRFPLLNAYKVSNWNHIVIASRLRQNSSYGKTYLTTKPYASQIGEPERILEIPDPVPVANPAVPSVSPDSVPDFIPDDWPVPTPQETETRKNTPNES